MDKAARRQAQRDWIERKRSMGIYVVRCTPTGEAWVGASRNLDKRQNALWFTLRVGSSTEKALQAAWTAHGDAAFSYEVVEETPDDNPHAIDALLRERLAYWKTKLGAGELWGAI